MFGACIRRQYPLTPIISPGGSGSSAWRSSGGMGMAALRFMTSGSPPSSVTVNKVWRSLWRSHHGIMTTGGGGGELLSRSLVTRNYAVCSASLVLGDRCRMGGSRRKKDVIAGGVGCQQLIPVRYKFAYSNFGHKPVDMSGWTVLWLLFLVSTMYACWLDWEYIFEKMGWNEEDDKAKKKKQIDKSKMELKFPKVDAAEISKHDCRDKLVRKDDDGSDDVVAKKPSKLGFRDRKIIEYENRIRQYSTPDKTFRYFATLQVIHPSGDNEVFMTPDDFLRSITPGIKQPEGLGLDQFKRYDPKLAGRLELELESDSIFYRLGSHGLISFSDYVFLLTVLSTSRRHFEIAFRMFDLNGDGDVDVEEFEKVTALIRQRTSVGARHREMSVSQNSLRETNSALNSYFFGVTRREKLTIEKFLEFQMQLQTEILNLEFRRKGPDDNGRISESDFSELLLAYAGYPAKRKARMLKRVKKKSKEEGYATGVSLEDYLKFFHLLSNIQDVDTALTFYHIAGAAIDPLTLKHVARTVAHVELSDHIIDVVFTLFDENQDGQLSNREFVAVMKNRLMRGLEKPKDTGFFKLLTSIGRCAKESLPR